MEDVTSELPIQIDGKLNNWFMVASVINKEKVQKVQKTFWYRVVRVMVPITKFKISTTLIYVSICIVLYIHTSVSAVNTCDIFRAFPVSVVVTYPNTFGFDVSRTTQQTLVISWVVTTSWKIQINTYYYLCNF